MGDREACDEEFMDGYTGISVLALIIALGIKIGVYLFKKTQFAEKNISPERYNFIKSFCSVFFSLHLMPLILIDHKCEWINPIFGDLFAQVVAL